MPKARIFLLQLQPVRVKQQYLLNASFNALSEMKLMLINCLWLLLQMQVHVK
ncbi:Uncharacterised protein [Mycobacteroides abscessus subsp. abscessus]|nr:Uncharacterised protein [Mycobacteroides abscessus subsp. abscessus]